MQWKNDFHCRYREHYLSTGAGEGDGYQWGKTHGSLVDAAVYGIL